MTGRLRRGDLVDIVLRRAVVRAVNTDGTVAVIHTDEQLDYFDPAADDVEVSVVGSAACGSCDGDGCQACHGAGWVFR